MIPPVMVFPTHVGMNLQTDRIKHRNLSIPHTRGDEPKLVQWDGKKAVYSPHTWG